LSAASFEALARHRGRPGALDVPKVPEQVPEVAVDRGGFVAATHGGYRFSWAAYEALLFAQRDLARIDRKLTHHTGSNGPPTQPCINADLDDEAAA